MMYITVSPRTNVKKNNLFCSRALFRYLTMDNGKKIRKTVRKFFDVGKKRK